MVEKKDEEPRCGQCKEVMGCVWCNFVYCRWLGHDVYVDSLMCDHGKDLLEMF